MGMVMQTGLTSTIFLSANLLLISLTPRPSPTVRSLHLSSSVVFNSLFGRGWLVHLDESLYIFGLAPPDESVQAYSLYPRDMVRPQSKTRDFSTLFLQCIQSPVNRLQLVCTLPRF